MCLSKEAKILKANIKEIAEKFKDLFTDTDMLFVSIDVYESWYTKKGMYRRTDLGNREKFMIDSIFDGLNVDDKQIFKLNMSKKDSNQEYSIVTIKVI